MNVDDLSSVFYLIQYVGNKDIKHEGLYFKLRNKTLSASLSFDVHKYFQRLNGVFFYISNAS